ncbi:MAG: extracellular solute-binding protein [Anaerolineales bacterium]
MTLQDKTLTRRGLLRLGCIGAGAALLAACQPKVVEVEKVVKETVIVEGTPQVVEKVVEKVATGTPAPQEKIELAIYGFQGAALEPTFAAIAPRFMEQYPNIDVLSKSYAGAPGETEERMITRLAAGERPDSMWLHTLRTFEFNRLQVLEKLNDDTVFPGYSDLEQAIYPQMIERLKLDMLDVYIMPNCIDIHCPTYNLDMVDQAGLDADNPPKTWEELLVWLEALQGYGNWPVDLLVHTAWAIMLYLASYPGMYTDSIVTIADTTEYKSLLNTEPVVNSVKLFKDIFDKGWVAPEKAAPGANFFNDQLVPIAFTPSNRGYAEMQRAIGDKFRWAPIGYPLPPNAKMQEPAVTGVGDGMGQVIFKIAEHKAEAWEWVKFCTEIDQQADFGRNYYTPARADMANHPYLDEGIPQHKQAVALAKNGIPRVGMEYTRVEAIIQQEYQRVLFEDKPVEEAMESASQQYDELLKALQEARAAS